MISKRVFWLLAAFLFGGSHLALAASSTYYFNGTCSDCVLQSGDGLIGTLVLNDYTEGDGILYENFESFSYVGSDIVFPIVVLPGDVGSVGGAIGPAFAAPYDFYVDFIDGLRFESSVSGDWYMCAPGPGGFYSGTCDFLSNNDFGLGSWNTTPGAIPIPAAAWLFGSALLGLVAAGRRKAA